MKSLEFNHGQSPWQESLEVYARLWMEVSLGDVGGIDYRSGGRVGA